MKSQAMSELIDIVQGSREWHALRKTKITATDSCSIMQASPWKTRLQLYHEKLSDDPPTPPNERMQRGIDLEPIARELFIKKTGIIIEPQVIVRDWAMASLDGIDIFGSIIVEIKCPGEKDHSIALSGKVPDHYYPQVQHQIYVSDAYLGYYFSFDGKDGVTVEVKRDDEYIEKMIVEEKKFYDCLINKIPPEPEERDYVQRNDLLWKQMAYEWVSISDQIKDLEILQEELRRQIIYASGESNTKGAGISLSKFQRKGNVDYSIIPELKGVDLDKYRKGSINSWRITCD